jgi:hypothetical protein
MKSVIVARSSAIAASGVYLQKRAGGSGRVMRQLDVPQVGKIDRTYPHAVIWLLWQC